MGRRLRAAGLVAAVLLTGAAAAGRATAPVYYPDDPLLTDVETRDASKVGERGISDPFDFLENTFFHPGQRTPARAANVNTIDEVPDSSWFANRIIGGPAALTAADIARGPNLAGPLAPGPWTVISGKSDGITPGFTIRDTAGTIWFIKFDPQSNPELATGAEMIATKLFWALGYHVPENHLGVLDPDNLVVADTASFRDPLGVRRRLTRKDVDTFLAKGARRADGRFRVIASRALPGRPVGPFKYFGTRPDDPNDIFPHEHRRELRGLRAGAAWLNHDDSRSINSLDTVADVGGHSIVRHHLIDFGSTLGSASVAAQRPRAGHEYIFEARPSLAAIATLGMWVRPWMKVKYPDFPAIGNIEAAFFDAAKWKPEYPNAAFDNARPDDLFWAARRVAAVPDDAVRAAVASAEFSDPAGADYLTQVILTRRDKVARTWITAVNPLVDFALAADGTFTFGNAAVAAGHATAAERYELQWGRFDNDTGTSSPIGAARTATGERTTAPAEALSSAFVEVVIRTHHPDYPHWGRPVTVHFRRRDGGWQLVGVRREVA